MDAITTEATSNTTPRRVVFEVGEHVFTPSGLSGGPGGLSHADGDHGIVAAVRANGDVLVVGWAEGRDAWVHPDGLRRDETPPHDSALLHWAAVQVRLGAALPSVPEDYRTRFFGGA